MKPPLLPNTLTLGLVVATLLLPELAAAADVASFESFYRKSWTVSWVMVAVAAIIAAGLVMVGTGGSAGPVVAGVGTWIGGLFGYSGVAATNFGLALLGGGSIAAGGLGMAGGAVVLTAVFTFGTDIVLDYATSGVIEKYDYERFVKDSEKMLTLPLPRRESGPPAYEAAMKVLERVDKNVPLSSAETQTIVRNAITGMIATTAEPPTVPEKVRLDTMASLLYFVTNDYRKAKERANTAYRLALAESLKKTLPAFLFATSSLYDENVDARVVISYFRYAVQDEPENPLTPIMFAIFLDRMMYRLNDGKLSANDLREVIRVAEHPKLGEQWAPIQVISLSHYLVRLKVEQQKISSLALSANSAITSSAKTLATVTRSLSQYESLLEGAQYVSGALSSPGARLAGDGWTQVGAVRGALARYSGDRTRLRELVAKLEASQAKVRPTAPAASKPASEPADESPFSAMWLVAVLLSAAVAGAVGYWRGAARAR